MDLYWKQYSLSLVFYINIGVSLFYISIFKIVCRNVYYWWAQNFSNTMIWVYLLVHITHVQYNLVNVWYFDSSSKFWSGPGTMKCRRARFWSQSQFSTIYSLCKVRLRSKLSLSKFYVVDCTRCLVSYRCNSCIWLTLRLLFLLCFPILVFIFMKYLFPLKLY